MYLPPAFRLDDLESQHAAIRRHPLATLVTRSRDGALVADHIPMMIDASRGDKGVLRAHVARANPLWKTHPADVEVLAIFAGVDHYITPAWYATKAETGKVVPTWNYVAVHARGPLQVFDDPQWLREQVGALTRLHEASRTQPWDVTDAPPDFVAAQLRAIVGIEIPITAIEGKRKTSQNRPAADRAGVVAGLRELGDDDSDAMANLVAEAAEPDKRGR